MATRVKIKAARRAENAEKRPHARVTHVRIAPSKVRIVIDLVRGKPVDTALSILQYTPKAASPVVSKLIKSAVANAENNLEMDPKTLYVAEIRADQGPQAKRWRPRSRGMANPILKRSSHISVILDTIASDQAEEASN